MNSRKNLVNFEKAEKKPKAKKMKIKKPTSAYLASGRTYFVKSYMLGSHIYYTNSFSAGQISGNDIVMR
jgi:hypothetical protein